MTQQENDPLVTLKLSRNAVGQITEGLHERMLTWQATAQYLEQGDSDITTIIEECSNPHEAKAIAEFYKKIINKINHQRKNQK